MSPSDHPSLSLGPRARSVRAVAGQSRAVRRERGGPRRQSARNLPVHQAVGQPRISPCSAGRRRHPSRSVTKPLPLWVPRWRFMRTASVNSSCVFSQVGVSCWGWCRFVGLVVDSITTNHVTRPSSRRRSMIPVPRCRCRYLCDTRRSVRRSSRFPVWRARLPFRYSLPLRELSRIARLRVVLSAAPPVGRSPPAPASGSLLTVVGFVRFVRWCGSRWRPHRPTAH